MSDAVIRTTRLVKRYGTLRAVDGLDLTVTRGQIFGFLGPNGAGKTTTIRVLTGLIRPTGGKAEVLGYDIVKHPLAALRRVGALVETPAFYEYLSGRKNLEILSAMSGGASRERIDEVLRLVDLLPRAKDKVGAYSHGMKQRLGIAQALLPNPELLILDEPASGLDPNGLIEVRDLLRDLGTTHGVTVFLSSHLLHEVEQICSHVGVVYKGKLVTQGAVADLLGKQDGVVVHVDDVARAEGIITDLGWQCQREPEPSNDHSLWVSVPRDRAAALNKALVTAGVQVSALLPQTLSLERLYMSLTEKGA